MESLEGKRVVVTGGSRGLGLGIVEALVANKARVTVVARNRERLDEVARRLGVTVVAGDVTELEVAKSVLAARPEVVVLNAGVSPPMAPLDQFSWEDFSATWNNDVKAGLHWIGEALRAPLPAGSRVLIASSGAAVNGSPLSGGHAGAKRMLWLMAHYANGVSAERNLGVRFQTFVPLQLIGDTEHGRNAAEPYARKKGVPLESFLAGFGKPMSPADVGAHIVRLLTDEAFQRGTAFGLKGDTGITSLDAPA